MCQNATVQHHALAVNLHNQYTMTSSYSIARIALSQSCFMTLNADMYAMEEANLGAAGGERSEPPPCL